MKAKEKWNGRQSRCRLLNDDSFRESWSILLASPAWADKSPRAILAHLDRLTEFPTDFATRLVDRAIMFGLPFVVQDNCIERLFEEWECEEAVRNFVPPTVEEVAKYCREKGFKINPAKFVRYYEKRGWRSQSGQVLITWRAYVYTWNFNKKYYDWD